MIVLLRQQKSSTTSTTKPPIFYLSVIFPATATTVFHFSTLMHSPIFLSSMASVFVCILWCKVSNKSMSSVIPNYIKCCHLSTPDPQSNHRSMLSSWPTLHCGAITLSKHFTVKWLSVHIYPNKFETKRHQNRQSLLKYIFTVFCETQHLFACSLQTSR